jgi:hypothetical protein
MTDRRRILVFATKGAASNDERRILGLLSDHDVEVYSFDPERKAANLPRILRLIGRRRPELVVMEGTGVVGGLAVLLGRALKRVPFVVSSGDAVGPFLAATHRGIHLPAWAYEVLLCRASAGYIGWTPYLAGRALTLGAPRAVTAAGFTQHPEPLLSRSQVRDELGLRHDVLVFGIVGALNWTPHRDYCYGLELVQAIRRVERADVAALIVGGGSGLARLRELAGEELGRRVFLPGPVPHELVASYLAAMDVGSLPQSLDRVGALRYTTKISEYVTARLPLVTGRLPVAYDLAESWSWRLPGPAPWSEEYLAALAQLMERLTAREVARHRRSMPEALSAFEPREQRRAVSAFITDLLDDLARSPRPGSLTSGSIKRERKRPGPPFVAYASGSTNHAREDRRTAGRATDGHT